jgi:predicted glycoside hydrolase/deacetylase ChbG (UPF0249 family)
VLIVCADDFGAAPSATNAILTAYESGAITTASAMVWMRDSDRSAQVVGDTGLPLGLHLNLTLPYTADDVPEGVRERQAAMAAVFTSEGWREGSDPPPDPDTLRLVVAEQLDRFRELFGEPDHVNGHHHVHVQDPVLDVLPRRWPLRPLLRRPAQADARPSRRERAMAERFDGPRLAFAFEHLHPERGGEGLATLQLARDQDVEVMTHPQHQAELDALLGEEWLGALDGLPRGSHADLGRRTVMPDSPV